MGALVLSSSWILEKIHSETNTAKGTTRKVEFFGKNTAYFTVTRFSLKQTMIPTVLKKPKDWNNGREEKSQKISRGLVIWTVYENCKEGFQKHLSPDPPSQRPMENKYPTSGRTVKWITKWVCDEELRKKFHPMAVAKTSSKMPWENCPHLAASPLALYPCNRQNAVFVRWEKRKFINLYSRTR